MSSSEHATDRTRQGEDAVFVVGGGAVGRAVADRLAADGETVTRVDRSPTTDPPPGQTVRTVDALDAHSLRGAGLDEATTVLALEPDDATNLLVAQLARTTFGVERVLVRTNDPDRASAFELGGVETVDAAAALARAVADRW
ncbi:TrkA-N domain protein [Halobacterium hubeiense]|uniref:TrkA-N domain protein n=2 Tax=Halobacterium hubeiense TaxID=1407499 RepID=A0A0U5H4K4_9EURY|nr:NAD-binding protein [Halobacterium hubeiense]CQH57502.1 TrkA-N domain protein [Halobacterium hubeiense]